MVVVVTYPEDGGHEGEEGHHHAHAQHEAHLHHQHPRTAAQASQTQCTQAVCVIISMLLRLEGVCLVVTHGEGHLGLVEHMVAARHVQDVQERRQHHVEPGICHHRQQPQHSTQLVAQPDSLIAPPSHSSGRLTCCAGHHEGRDGEAEDEHLHARQHAARSPTALAWAFARWRRAVRESSRAGPTAWRSRPAFTSLTWSRSASWSIAISCYPLPTACLPVARTVTEEAVPVSRLSPIWLISYSTPA